MTLCSHHRYTTNEAHIRLPSGPKTSAVDPIYKLQVCSTHIMFIDKYLAIA